MSVHKSQGKFSSSFKVSGYYPKEAKNKHENRFSLFNVRCRMVWNYLKTPNICQCNSMTAFIFLTSSVCFRLDGCKCAVVAGDKRRGGRNVNAALADLKMVTKALKRRLVQTYIYIYSYTYIKVKWSRYRSGVAQRVDRGIALLFHDRGTRRGWVVSSTSWPHFTPGKDPVPILQEAGWAPGPVWTGGKSRPHRDSIRGPSSP